MAEHPARNRSVRCAVSQSARATYEISRRSSPTAITSATSITAKFPSLHSNIMRWHHDNPRRFKISPANWSQPQAGLQRRNYESSGCPLLLFCVGLLSKPQRFPSDNMENKHEEVHTFRCSCNYVYIACNLGNGTASDLGTGILCAVLSQCELSE
jgi:hypothetical protein